MTDVHTNLPLTVLQIAFSLHSVSVTYLCYILCYKHHYECSHCAQSRRYQLNTNCKWPHITPPNPGASWMTSTKHWLVAPQAAHSCVTEAGTAQWLCWLKIDGRAIRWLRVACIKRTELVCKLLRHPSWRFTQHSWITTSHPAGWVGCLTAL